MQPKPRQVGEAGWGWELLIGGGRMQKGGRRGSERGGERFYLQMLQLHFSVTKAKYDSFVDTS